MEVVHELLATTAAVEKLGARSISVPETQQLLSDRHVVVKNRGRRTTDEAARRLLIGRSAGGRPLTLVVEATLEPTSWVIVTGWESTARERKVLEGAHGS